jgi:hypothetical protein
MSSIKLLSKNLKLTEKLDVDYLFKLPCVYYKYPEVPKGETDHWMHYDYPSRNPGVESYARFLKLHYWFPDLAIEVTDYFRSLMPRYNFDFKKISVTCTKGFVYPHKDGNSRTRIQMCARNTAGSKFFTSNDIDYALYETRKKLVDFNDGDLYLIKTETVHELIPRDVEVPLFFYTYTFSDTYESLID